MTSLTKRAANAAWWSVLETAARFGVQFIVTILLARLLEPSDFGVVAMLTVLTSIGALLVDAGFGTALIQQQSTDDDETTVFVFSTCMACFLALILLFGAPAIAHFFHQPALVDLIRLVALTLPLGGLAAVPDALLARTLDFKAKARAQIVASIASGLVGVWLALKGFGVWSLVWQAIIAAALRTAILWGKSGWRPRGRFRIASFRRLARFGGYMFFSGGLDTIYGQAQPLLIGRLFDARALGYFTLAQTSQQAPASFLGSVMNRVGLPVFSSIAHDRDKLLQGLRMTLRVAMFFFAPCMIGLALVAKPLVILIYGDTWSPAAPILSILALGTSMWPIHVLNLAAINAKGRSDLFFRLDVIKKTVAIVVILLISPWGAIGMAWASVAVSIFGVVVNTHYSEKLLHYGMVLQLRDQSTTFLLTGAAAAIGWCLLHWLPLGLATMLLAVSISASAYLGLSLLVRHSAIADLSAMWRSLYPKSEALPINRS